MNITAAAHFALARRARHAAVQPINDLMTEALRNPDLISLAAGFVDYDTLPGVEVADAVARLLRQPETARSALQYGTTEGAPELRRLLYEHLAQLDGVEPDQLPGSPEQILITNGSQQLLHILTDLLVDPGDIVLTAWPSYFVYSNALTAFEAVVRCVDLDEQGMVPASLDALLAHLHEEGQLHRVKLLYLQDYHQNPTGLMLAPERREQILDVIRKWSDVAGHRILILEDAAYRELTFDGQPPHSLKLLDHDDAHVALLQTFSKPFAPGLKLGYGLLPRDLVEAARINKGSRDFGTANLCQQVAAQVLRGGKFKTHAAELCRAYAVKRDAMLTALDVHFGPMRECGVSWTKPTGGLYVWLTLPPQIDTGRDGALFAAAVDAGVLYVPGAYCFPVDPSRTVPRHHIRLSFGVPSVQQIRQGIERLSKAVYRLPC